MNTKNPPNEGYNLAKINHLIGDWGEQAQANAKSLRTIKGSPTGLQTILMFPHMIKTVYYIYFRTS